MHDLRSADVNCVIGFSTSIFRRDGQEPNSHAICSESHDLVHKGCYEAFANYMSVSEVKELAALDNVFLACHGDMHLRLEDAGKGKIEASRIFSIDVHAATKKLRALGLSTDIFVYPYAYDGFVAARKTLEKNGYKFVFAGRGSQRTPVESLSSDGQILFE